MFSFVNILTLISAGDLSWRIFHFIINIIQRQNTCIHQQARICFDRSWPSVAIVFGQIFYHLSQGKYDDLCILAKESAAAGIIYCLYQTWNERTLLSKSRFLWNSDDLDCSSAMAENFLHGYLKIILPPRGEGNKGIVERINDFEDKEDIAIPVKKLLLVLPRDLYFPPLLSDASDQIIKICNLEQIVCDRAGTTRRIYRNTIYRVNSRVKDYYVVAEAATPLLSFYESMKTRNGKLKLLAEEIYQKFCKSIEDLLQSSPECRDLIIPIRVPNNTSGENADLAKVLSDVVEEHLYPKVNPKSP